MLVEVGCDLVKSLAPSFWHPEKGEDEEEEEERSEYQEDVGPAEVLRSNSRKGQALMRDSASVSTGSRSALVSFHTYSNILETHANDEVGSPVGTTSNSHRSRSGTL